MTTIPLEVCVDTIEGAWTAAEHGADRIELCAALSEGGLTPSAGLMSAASKLPVPVYAMIRPRTGDFRYSDAEKTLMLRDIHVARQEGLNGIVIGATTEQRKLDRDFLSTALEGAALPATLHRAFDILDDVEQGVEDAISLGFERILSSGQEERADQGIDRLASIAKIARGRISLMAGSGINEENVGRILSLTTVDELHASCSSRSKAPSLEEPEGRLGFVALNGFKNTDAARVKALRSAIDRYLETTA
ncbi:MAG: copper homeostasis protein CutC [Roseibium sp.]|uniref:copper homeostasis protein CutC n=1 Tax=Roseibium sp. TaxID=1936156 RepID=UPI00261497D5|nr:copper homeostasis protein CutC [Roseibium sp.]MCV0427581.1 copper homeostasis protein CutC [Roseibium sp.]